MPLSTDLSELVQRAQHGDRRALARLISVVEKRSAGSGGLLADLYPRYDQAATTGLTGAPGAGKSTLVDRLIQSHRTAGREVAVLAVDPSSPFTGGAILGDRVRMQRHIDDSGVYIRSMASRGHLGGISEATPRASVVLAGAGFGEIIIETVGVGQAEVEIAETADTTVVVLNPGWGDSIQAAKAGLLEIGDVFVVNKADRPGVNETVRDLKQMLELGGHGDWWPPVISTVATTGEGIDDLAAAIDDHRKFLGEADRYEGLRRSRSLRLFEDALDAELRLRVRRLQEVDVYGEIRGRVEQRQIDPWSAARKLVGPDEPAGSL